MSDHVLTGYSAVFYDANDTGTVYSMGEFDERIAPGAFGAALADPEIDTLALFNHQPSAVLGRVGTNPLSLRMFEDSRGLRSTIIPNVKTGVGVDVLALVERQDIRGQSFSFTTASDRWEEIGDRIIRTVTGINRLFDVSPVSLPAYQSTTVKLATADRALIERLESYARRTRELSTTNHCNGGLKTVREYSDGSRGSQMRLIL